VLNVTVSSLTGFEVTLFEETFNEMLNEGTLHSLSWPPGGDSSGCIEVHASCVKAALSLLATRGDSSGCIEVYASCVKAAFSLLATRVSGCIEVYLMTPLLMYSLSILNGVMLRYEVPQVQQEGRLGR